MADYPVPHPARPLTDEEWEERTQDCFALDLRIKAGVAAGRASWWETARAVSEFHMHSGWSFVGFTTLKEWLQQDDIDMTESTYKRMVRVYDEVCMVKRVPFEEACKLSPSKLDVALPQIRASVGGELNRVLDEVQGLSYRELVRPAQDVNDISERPAQDVSPPASEEDHALDEAVAELIEVETMVGDLIDYGLPYPAIDGSCLPLIKEALAFRRSCLVNGEL